MISNFFQTNNNHLSSHTMALIKCPECGNMISDKAIKCPKCGCLIRREMATLPNGSFKRGNGETYSDSASSRKGLYAIIAVLATALVAFGVYFFISSSGKAGGNEEENVETTAHVTNGNVVANTPSTTDDNVKQEAPQQQEPTVQKQQAPKPTYTRFPSALTFSGIINGSKMDYNISMDMSIADDGKVNGHLVVLNGKQDRVKLTGTYNHQTNSLKLYEQNARTGRKTGYYFDALLMSRSLGYSLTGRYKCNKPQINWYFSAETH